MDKRRPIYYPIDMVSESELTSDPWGDIEWLTIKPVVESLDEEDQSLLYLYAETGGDVRRLAKLYRTTPVELQRRVDELIAYIRQEVGLDDEPIH
ncbi:MAG: hypothetical protein KatS3mg087_2107 [Patescibacteria group bacterium]|nr:MAG: hypothetical protein KatS3mg087_2107 [Patescibacteria group bacterium]